jgi:hypothetical protein
MKILSNWQFWTAVIGIGIALIGAVPQVMNWLSINTIHVKLISNYCSIVKFPIENTLETVYVQKLSLSSKNDDFFLKDIKVFIKYPGNDSEIEATIWIWKTNGLSLTFIENAMEVNKTLNINPNDYILNFTVLPKNASLTGYISYSVSYTKDEMFEYVKYQFIDFNDKVKERIITKADIRSNKLLHDDSIWTN